MKPTTPLKLCSIAFAVLWTGWMLWASGPIDRANVIIMSVCGAFAGWAWYYAMRFVFQLIHLLPPNDRSAKSRQ
jgi:ABC-type Co2+ transport system permease subunit